MKKILFIFITVLVGYRTSAQTNDPVANQILAINEYGWIGKPLDSIISVFPSGYLSMRVYGIRNTARFLALKYPNGVFVELHVRSFSYMEVNDPNHVWDVSLMRKEKLHSISVYYDTSCYRGCLYQ